MDTVTKLLLLIANPPLISTEPLTILLISILMPCITVVWEWAAICVNLVKWLLKSIVNTWTRLSVLNPNTLLPITLTSQTPLFI